MADSRFPTQARSVLSYHDEIWNISWGEEETIAALREEMSKEIQQGIWQSKSSQDSNSSSPWHQSHQSQPQSQPQAQSQMGRTTSYQLPTFQAVGIMMTKIPGTQCQVPAIVFSTQQEQCPPIITNAEANQTSTPQDKVRSRSRPSKTTRAASAAAAPRRITVDHNHKNEPSRTPLSKSCALAEAGPSPPVNNGEHEGKQAMMPTTCDGELPSIGSEGHFDGSCKRCAFFPKGRCHNGKDCTHCHFPHEPRSRLRKRAAAKACKGSCADENDVSEGAMVEDTCLSEVLAYLTEPAAVSGRHVARVASDKKEDKFQPDSKADLASPTKETSNRKDEVREAMVTTFNNALQEVAQAYMTDMGKCSSEKKIQDVKLTSSDHHGDAGDIDTTASVSALSDSEGTTSASVSFGLADVAKKEAVSETSDSEVASLQEATVGTAQLDQEVSPLMSQKRDAFTSSPTSWMASQCNRKAGLLESCTTVDIARMTRALLNKLTEERFESLCCQILALPLSTTEQLAVVVAEIFQKATTQDCFRALYTELCMRIDTHLAPQTSAIGGKAFRKALVTECQATFERSLQPPDASLFVNLNGDERFEVEMKLKTRRLGNMRFIGDLLVRRLLAPKLLPPIVHQLLNHNEAALESLIALLTVVSPEFEAKPSLYQAPLRDAFATLRRKMSDKAVSSRVRCQINDLFDAKARQWAPRSASA